MRKSVLALILACFMAISACAEGTVYTAYQNDESAVDVSGTENVVITDATILKTDGSASSADAASFRGRKLGSACV